MRKILVLAIVLMPAIAFAQYAPPPPPPGGGGGGYYAQPPQETPGIHRRGFLIGFSLGAGTMNCSECADSDALSGPGLDIHLGGMIAPNLAIMFDGWGVGHAFDGGTIVHVMDTAAVQAWVMPQFWIKGGIGAGQLRINFDNGQSAESDTGLGLFGAAGFEVFQGYSFALDLQLRLGTVKYDGGSVNMGAITVGANWY
jgi:hypothetical protein